MPGDPFKKVRTGDPVALPAAWFNATIDAIQRTRDMDRTGAGQGGGTPPPGVVLVKNVSGSDAARFGVLGVDGVVFSPTDNLDGFKNGFALTGTSPSATTHAGKFVVCLESIPNGAIGRAMAQGPCAVQVDVGNADDKFADAGDTTANLVSDPSNGSRILWKESGTGVKWAVVLVGSGGGGDPLPPGGLQYQVLTKVTNADGDVAWDWVRAHP